MNKPLSPLAQFEIDFLQKVQADFQMRSDLFSILHGVLNLHDKTDPTPALCQLLDSFIKDPRRSSGLTNDECTQVASIVRFIGLLHKIKSDFTCFDIESDFINEFTTAENAESEVRGD